MNISIHPFATALNSLSSAYTERPSDLVRDGLLQRFEYSLELAWKTTQKMLEVHGIRAETPKYVFQEAGRIGWINNEEIWVGFLESRRLSNYLFEDEVAERAFLSVAPFIREAESLLKTLNSLKTNEMM